MYWDGERWHAGDGPPVAPTAPRPRRQARDWAATATVALAVVALIVPLQGAGAAGGSKNLAATATLATAAMTMVEESSKSIRYSRGWTTADASSFLACRCSGCGPAADHRSGACDRAQASVAHLARRRAWRTVGAHIVAPRRCIRATYDPASAP